MTAIVIDASAAAPWVLSDESTPFSENFYAQVCLTPNTYHAPALWLWDLGNLLMNAVRRKRMTPKLAHEGLEHLKLCQIQFASPPSAHKQSQILRLALAHDLSYYDASYLELVLSLNGQLASKDSKLVTAAKACGVFCIEM
jgi:predicted nucleic acid-binding protein